MIVIWYDIIWHNGFLFVFFSFYNCSSHSQQNKFILNKNRDKNRNKNKNKNKNKNENKNKMYDSHRDRLSITITITITITLIFTARCAVHVLYCCVYSRIVNKIYQIFRNMKFAEPGLPIIAVKENELSCASISYLFKCFPSA